jgi:CheY-like chemotaxis protein
MENPMKILVVDDEQDVKTLFLQRFRKEIREKLFDFSFCYSGEEALAFLKDHEHEAILILSDINMPGMTGIELLRRIKSNSPAPPPIVMMITAYGDKDNYDQAIF